MARLLSLSLWLALCYPQAVVNALRMKDIDKDWPDDLGDGSGLTLKATHRDLVTEKGWTRGAIQNELSRATDATSKEDVQDPRWVFSALSAIAGRQVFAENEGRDEGSENVFFPVQGLSSEEVMQEANSARAWINEMIRAGTMHERGDNFIHSTPLQLAAQWGFLPEARRLLDLGADIGGRGSMSFDGNQFVTRLNSPLHLAAHYDQAPVAALLIERGADLDAKAPNSGETPLHMAARRGNVELVKLLIEHGADLDIENHVSNETPLEMASDRGIKEVLMDAMQRRAADTIRKLRKADDRFEVSRTIDVLAGRFKRARASSNRIKRMRRELVGIGVEPESIKEEVAVLILVAALAAACAWGVYRCATSAAERAAARREKELIEADAPAPAPRAPKKRAAKTPRRRDARPRRREQAAPAAPRPAREEKPAVRLTPASAPAVRVAAQPASVAKSDSEPEAAVAETARSAPEPEPAVEPAAEPPVAEAAPAPATAASVAESTVEPESESEPEPVVEAETAPAPAPESKPVEPEPRVAVEKREPAVEPSEEKVEEDEPPADEPAAPAAGYSLVASVLGHLGLAELLPRFQEQYVDDEAFVALEADDMNELGIEPHAALSILAAIADGARARKKLVTADFVDGVAKHQSVLEETLREHREEIARLRLRRGDVPEDLRCPLTLELFCDPVTAADGHTYERVAIEEWYATGSRTSPTTNEPLTSTLLIPQHTMKRLVCAFMEGRRGSVDDDDDDDDVPPAQPPRPAPAREAPAERPQPSYADMLRADEWPSLG